ncbi:SAM-dependent methyltransferase [Nonomuraea sp. NPDC050328]|uniref:SAM-dependent methyltransferase n=1 Tax=Nonomuraea sp. NPDC050328 TaxID=3364361 RepID=UPI0037AB7711
MSREHEIDPSIPSVARMYDYYLGGKDHFPADREAAEKIVALVPSVRQIAHDNRAFLGRAVRLLAARGVTQFLDIGSGLPTQQNTHQIAQSVAPEARVAYVDNDPVVLSHGRALLADHVHTIVVDADMRAPDELLAHPEIRGLLDFERPVAVLLLAMLHFVPGREEPAQILTALRKVLAPGSYVVVSNAFAGEVDPARLRAGERVYAGTSAGGVHSRTAAELAGLTEGFELLEPGIVPVDAWRVPEARPDFTKPGLLGLVARVN